MQNKNLFLILQPGLTDNRLHLYIMDTISLSELVFPKIPKDYKPSAKVLSMTCGSLPKDFDVEKELDKMWEERAK